MRFLHGLLRWFTALFLRLSILLLILAFAVATIVGNKQVTKDVLVESGVYERFIDSVVADNIKNAQSKTDAIPLQDSQIVGAARQAFSPAALKASSEEVIDSVYKWLDGDTASLRFNVDLNASRDQFVESVSLYAVNRLENLPLCTTTDLTDTILTLQCRPENIPLTYLRDKVKQDLLGSEFLKDMRISEQNLPKTETGELLYQRFDFVPKIYQIAKQSVWFSLVFIVLAMVFYVLARKPYRKGFKALGRDLFSNALTYLGMTLLFGYILPRYTQAFAIKGSDTTRLFNNVSERFVHRFDVLVINICLQLLALAILILALERLSRKETMYSKLAEKSGVATSVTPKGTASVSLKKRPPIQTSEGSRVVPNRRVNKKYRKIQL